LKCNCPAEFEDVAVFGLGYIGLPTAALIASRGIHVLSIDINEDVVRKISSGAVHIYEPDLDGLVQKVISSGALKVSMQPAPSDAFIIAAPTPINAERAPGRASGTVLL
jgi:UDP-N-acetyl-D-mannosaminuronic acid dehydrogenase